MQAPESYTWKRITDFDDPLLDAAWALYVESFPVCERRPREAYKEALEDPRFHAYVLFGADRHSIQGILWYWEICSVRYIEYLATAPEERGSGLGTRLLKMFMNAESTPVLLEIEELVDEATRRRWRFYERLGFTLHEDIHIHPPYVSEYAPHRLHILSVSPDFSASQRACFINTIATEIVVLKA